MPESRRGAVSRQFPCALGCKSFTLRRANKLCAKCWKEYGHIRPRPAWLRYLINAEERERYREEEGTGTKEVSLDNLIWLGKIEVDAMEIYRGPVMLPRKPRRRRGRPRHNLPVSSVQAPHIVVESR